MEPLSGLTNLARLDLSETLVGNPGLEHLKRLTQLEDLNLWGARVGDAGMPHVAEMRALKRLNLDNVGFPAESVALTDEGVTHLAGLSNLEFLHLGKTQVSDAGLAALTGLRNLKQLVITFCPRVTDAGVAKLKEAIPALSIDR
jgi:hypothetical protein